MKKIKLNKKELKKILRLMELKPEKTMVEIKVDASGIGEVVKIKIENDPQEHDVTDYLSW